MQAFIEAKREEIAELCRTHHVRRLSLFGSAARDDFDPQRSDVDFLVEFIEASKAPDYANNYFSLEENLLRLFGRKVDLVTASAIRNPYLLRAIDEDKELLYAA